MIKLDRVGTIQQAENLRAIRKEFKAIHILERDEANCSVKVQYKEKTATIYLSLQWFIIKNVLYSLIQRAEDAELDKLFNKGKKR